MRPAKPHARIYGLGTPWPESPIDVALIEPKIPPNTGNIGRTCAGTGCPLHLVEPLGFEITDQQVRRAGLDYWDDLDLTIHPSDDLFFQAMQDRTVYLFTTAGTKLYTDVSYQPGDVLVFGSETEGLSQRWLDTYPDQTVAIPLRADRIRSLNLAVSVGVAVYEALRQIGTQSTIS